MSKHADHYISARRSFCTRLLAGMTAVGAGACLRASPAMAQPAAREKVTPQAIETLLAGWPEKHQEIAGQIIEKYGLPNGGTTTRLLIWLDNDPWEYTMLHREGILHNFPIKHMDILEQAIAYRVPAEKCDDLAAYNGSVIVHRTKGEIAAMCEKEAMNFLALNLAHDIVTGKSHVEAARQTYTATAMAFMKGEKHPYTQALQFQMPQGSTQDPDLVTAT